MLRNKWMVLLAALLVIALVSGCGKNNGQAPKEDKQVVATYKDGEVTKDEFDKFKNIIGFFNPQFAQMAQEPTVQENVLKQLVAYEVLNERADKASKDAAEKKAKEQFDEIKKLVSEQQKAGQESLDSLLKKQNITEDDVVAFLQQDETARQYMGKKVTDAQVKQEYDKNLKKDKDFYTYATVSHILVQTMDPQTGKEARKKSEALKIAKEVKTKLDAGGNFAELAKKYSDDPGSKNNGGTYKDAQISSWVPAFKKAAATLPLNKISDPVETEYGYHIMKVESRSNKKLDEMKDKLRDTLSGQQMNDFITKEVPGLITKTNLPKPPANQNPGGAPQPGTPQPGTPQPGTPQPDNAQQPDANDAAKK